MSVSKYSIKPEHITVDIDTYNQMMVDMLTQQCILDNRVINNMNADSDKKYVKIQQLTAIRVEACEGIDHIGHKWWSSRKEMNKNLVFGEIIDIIHFSLSKVLDDYCNKALGKDYKESSITTLSISEAYKPIHLDLYEDRYSPELEDSVYNVNEKLIRLFEHIILITFNSPSSMINMLILDTCFTLASEMGYNDLYVYKHYMGKCALNHLRAMNKYGDGYKKIWGDGREDNEHLMDIVNSLEKLEDMSVDNILGILKVEYTINNL